MLGKSSPLSFLLVPCYTLCRLDCVYSFHVWCLVQFVCRGKHKLEVCFFSERSNSVLYVLLFYLYSKQMEISEERYACIQTFVTCMYPFYL